MSSIVITSAKIPARDGNLLIFHQGRYAQEAEVLWDKHDGYIFLLYNLRNDSDNEIYDPPVRTEAVPDAQGGFEPFQQGRQRGMDTMTLRELIEIANTNYPDGYIVGCFEDRNVGQDDGLAKFIVDELTDSYDGDATDEQQLDEALRVITNAMRQVLGVVNDLEYRRNVLTHRPPPPFVPPPSIPPSCQPH